MFELYSINDLDIKKQRYIFFEQYLKTHNFDDLMYRLILEHNNDWCEKCWHSGHEIYPNNKLFFIIDYIINNCKTVEFKQIKNKNIPSKTWKFMGYYFQLQFFGKFVKLRIYNVDDNECILDI